MLKIRQEQMDAITAARWDGFFSRAARHVRATRPADTHGMSDQDLRRVFESSVERSHRFGFRTERQIGCVFEASLVLGDRFETRKEYGWAPNVLQSRHLGPSDRANLLLAMADAAKESAREPNVAGG